MHPDYKHNPPNYFPPPPPPCVPPRPPRFHKQYFYVILFVHSKNIDEKGQAIIYRRKTLDMLFDLIGDIDEQYYHTLYDNADLTFLDQETRNIDVEFRVVYTDNVYDVIKLINPNGYIVKFDWEDIPNMNYPNQFYYHPFPHKYPKPVPPPPGAPPMPKDYVGTQRDFTNDCIERFGDEP